MREREKARMRERERCDEMLMAQKVGQLEAERHIENEMRKERRGGGREKKKVRERVRG